MNSNIKVGNIVKDAREVRRGGERNKEGLRNFLRQPETSIYLPPHLRGRKDVSKSNPNTLPTPHTHLPASKVNISFIVSDSLVESAIHSLHMCFFEEQCEITMPTNDKEVKE